jgi:hypothetical protein
MLIDDDGHKIAIFQTSQIRRRRNVVITKHEVGVGFDAFCTNGALTEFVAYHPEASDATEAAILTDL